MFSVGLFIVSAVLYRQEVNLSEMKMKMEILENRAEILLRDRNDLNWMLGVILTFDPFPVRDFCRENSEYVYTALRSRLVQLTETKLIK